MEVHVADVLAVPGVQVVLNLLQHPGMKKHYTSQLQPGWPQMLGCHTDTKKIPGRFWTQGNGTLCQRSQNNTQTCFLSSNGCIECMYVHPQRRGGCLPHQRAPPLSLYMSYGSAPCALSNRDPVNHIFEPPTLQELS